MEKINSKQSLALLWLTIMNQSQNSKAIIANISILFERLSVDKDIANIPYEEIYHAMTMPTKLHRFPKKMSEYLYKSLVTIYEKFGNQPSNIFKTRDCVTDNLLLFSGIGMHKALIALYKYDCLISSKILPSDKLHCNINPEDISAELVYLQSLGETGNR